MAPWPRFRRAPTASAILAVTLLVLVFHVPAVLPSAIATTPGVEADPPKVQLAPAETRPLLAIIIDDLGWGVLGTAEVLALPYRLTMAVLPDGPFSRSEAQQAWEKGHEVFLHLPMEPRGAFPAVPRFVTVDQTDEAIRARVRYHLLQIPHATGVNNHMGSRATSDRRVARAVLEVVSEHGLVFVDSRTWHLSVMRELAAELGIPAAVNQVFLDNIREAETIRRQLWKGAALAQAHGRALVLGHVHPLMASVLAEEIPRLLQAGIAVVPASRVVDWDVERPQLRLR